MKNMTFSILTPPRILVGSVDSLGPMVFELQAKNVAILTDPGIVKSGALHLVQAVLEKEGLSTFVVDKVIAEVPIDVVDEIAKEIKGPVDLIIGLGGGSSLDTAKLVAMLYTNGGQVSDYLGVNNVPLPSLPMVLIPTTAGTGSEVTPAAIINDPADNLKKAIISPNIMAKVAFLDPELTYTCPPFISAITGMDAFVHAIEAYTSIHANHFTDMLALQAVDLIVRNIRKVYKEPDKRDARHKMALGSMLAGMAFGNSSVAAIHGLSYPLGGYYALPHGLANTLMAPPILKYNLPSCIQEYSRLALASGQIEAGGLSELEMAEKFIDIFIQLSMDLNIPLRLQDVNIPKYMLSTLAQATVKNQRLLDNNPRSMALEDVLEIYKAAW